MLIRSTHRRFRTRRSYVVSFVHVGWVYQVSQEAYSYTQAVRLVSGAFPGAQFVWVGAVQPGPAFCL